MLLLYAYVACSITIALSIVIEVYRPALMQAIEEGVDTNLTRSPYLGMFVAFLINLVLAPAMLLVILMPGAISNLHTGFSKVIREQE